MSVDLGTATVQIAADTSSLSRGIDGAKVLMLGLGAAAAAAAGEALKMAGDLQAQNTMLATSAGEQLKNLGMIQAGVLKTSTDTGTSTTQLEAALYKIESAGLHGQSALDALTAAARGAKLENSDLGVVADAETTLMVDYANKHITATQAMNDLIATVARGKTNIQDLSASMASILPTASAVGVSLYDASAAMATMTAEGSPAANAATYLRQMLLALEVPGGKAVTIFEKVGLTAEQVSNEMKKSLPDTLQMITDAIGKKFPEGSAAYVSALKDVAGGQKNFQAWLELTGSHLKVFQQNAEGVTQAVKTAGTSISGWSDIQGNFNLQIDKTHASLDAMMIKVGNELMPIVSQFLTQDVDPAIAHFEDWETNTTGLHDTFVTLSQVIGTVIGDVETLVGDVANFVGWVQQGSPGVVALAGGLSAVGTAIGLIKIEEFAAGWYNTFSQMREANGIIAGMADKALPNLGQALGWTKTAAQETTAEIAAIAPVTLSASEQAQADIDSLIASFDTASVSATGTGVAIGTIGTEAGVAETEVAVAAGGMSVALGVATAGISILVGAVAAGIANAVANTNNATLNMSENTKKAYDSLGTSAQDNNAKAAAAAEESGHNYTGFWQKSALESAQAVHDKTAQMILDQQRVADAAAKAAKTVQDSYNQGILDLAAELGVSVGDITGHKNLPVPTTPGTHGGHVVQAHASGGVIPPGQYGIVDDQPGASNGELMYGGSSGISVLPAGPTAALFGGGGARQPVVLNFHVDSRQMASWMIDDIASLLQHNIRLVGGQRR